MSESNLEQVIEAVKSLSPAEQQTLRELLEESAEKKSEEPPQTDDLAERGRRYYDEHLRAQLEPEHNGRFCAIEPESGAYFLGRTGLEALRAGHEALPGKRLCLMRVGHKFAYRVGGYGIRIRRSDR
jgi:hypothetical protein